MDFTLPGSIIDHIDGTVPLLPPPSEDGARRQDS